MNSGPLTLFHRGSRVGSLTSYGYETPWASAWLVADDPAALARYAAISAFLEWSAALPDDLPEAEADTRYDQELAARGLSAADLDDFAGDWQIQPAAGERVAISLYQLDADGYIRWRW